MKAMFVAPDITVLAQMLSISTTQKELVENVKGLINSEEYEDKLKQIVENPANLRYGWVRFDKTEENVDFMTALLLLSANNNYSISTKDVIFTAESAFVNINLLESFKSVSKEGADINIDLADKINSDKLLSLAEGMFGEPQFMELYSSKDGPEMFMLGGSMSVDTWSMLSTIGLVSSRSFAKSTGNSKDRVPGFCILFGMSMTTLMHIVSNADKMPSHIADDINRLPRAKKAEEDEKS